MSNVVLLRKSKLREAFEEVEGMKPDQWVLVGLCNTEDTVRVFGPENFDLIQMYGMLEYAKSRIEPRNDNEQTPKRIG